MTSALSAEDLRWFIWGKAARAWNMESGFTATDAIDKYIQSLVNRGVYLRWDDTKIYALLTAWSDRHHADLNGHNLQAAIDKARTDTKPRRGLAPTRKVKGDTPTWRIIQRAFGGDIRTAKEIAELTGLSRESVRQQLCQKLRMCWVQQPAYGQYSLTSLCGSASIRSDQAEPAEIERTTDQLLTERDELRTIIARNRAHNQPYLEQAKERDQNWPRDWRWWPEAKKSAYIALYGERGSVTLPGTPRLRSTRKYETHLIEVEMELADRGYYDPAAPTVEEDLELAA